MTCIVGLVDKGTVYMGGDSCASSDYAHQIVGNPKVFRIGEMILGVCGSFRLIDLLRFSVQGVAETDQHPERFLRTTFTENVYNVMEKYHESEKGELQGCLLIGYKGALYEMQSDYSILNAPEWGLSVGSGVYAARGALHALSKHRYTPEKKVMMALEAAEAVAVGVKGPFKVITLEPDKAKNNKNAAKDLIKP